MANPGQRWQTRLDGRGFTTTPDGASWTWGLELLSYGFEGAQRTVETPLAVNAEGARVAYDWDETLEEWYVNDGRGLEHGYTVHERPEGGESAGPLQLHLAVRGDLEPAVNTDGRGVRFLDDAGISVLTYTGLVVFDADGTHLDASLARRAGGLVLSVDERAARYPLTIDPVAQQAYLKASNTDADDRFGVSVAISGNTVVVGANGESSSATGVDGDQGINSAAAAGAAYVFVRTAGVWSQQAYLKASNAEAFDRFGSSVAISGDTIVVGAQFEGSAATGVDGDQSDNSAAQSGAVYVFVRSADVWSQQAYIKASNTDVVDNFGWSVAVSGDTIVVGSPNEESAATGIDGDQSDNSTRATGAVYVFVRHAGAWSQHAYLKGSNTGRDDSFGSSVAVDSDTIVVGTHREDSAATGIDGDQSDNSVAAAGAAYVFVRNAGTWSQQAYLKASNTDAIDSFGWSVAISGDTIVVSAPDEDSGATGIDGDQGDNSASRAGAAYVFVRNAGAWSQQAYLKASNAEWNDKFGHCVAISDDTIVVSALAEEGAASGVDGDQSDNSANDAGAAYVFVRNAGVWSQQTYLKASNPEVSDYFGWAVAVDGGTVVVTTYHEDSAATGIDGDQSDNSAENAGAAYVFDLTPACDVTYDTIAAWPPKVSIAGNGVQDLAIVGGCGRAGEIYYVIGNLSGTTPATPIGGVLVPLAYDFWFDFTFLYPNTVIAGSVGIFDATGYAEAKVTLPPKALDPDYVGAVFHHAWVSFDQVTFDTTGVSNAVSLELVP
jgi:hypothetical protein